MSLIAQWKRLSRHLAAGAADYDEASLLDLAHTLRIWCDMKREVDMAIVESGTAVRFPNLLPIPAPQLKLLRRGIYGDIRINQSTMALSSGLKLQLGRILLLEHDSYAPSVLATMKKHQHYSQPATITIPHKCSFTEWIAMPVVERQFRGKDGLIERITLSREIVIRRIANLLGGSHPQRRDGSSDSGNRYDAHVLALHNVLEIVGRPLSYCIVIGIAHDIRSSLAAVFESDTSSE